MNLWFEYFCFSKIADKRYRSINKRQLHENIGL